MTPISLPSIPLAGSQSPTIQDPLRKASRALESNFIAEMLKSAGVGQSRGEFGGGQGEDGFASFLVTAQAEMIVKAGGFGLADKIYESLLSKAAVDEQ
jgi:peptidoglycan hydrolase FlgJ